MELGLIYDLLRILRRTLFGSFFWTALMDLTFWGYTAYRTFYMMHTYSDGTLRWFAVLGVLVVVGVYMKCFSPYILRLGIFLLKPFRILLNRLLNRPKKSLTKTQKVSIMKVAHCFRKEKAHGEKNSISDQILQ